MPTYEYECKSCAHTFETFQSMSDAPLKKCPQCGKSIRRLINGGAGLIFKGSGFYVTDKNKDGGSSKPGKAADSAPADTAPTAGSAASPESSAIKEKPASAEKPKSTAEPAGEKAPAPQKNKKE